MTTAQRNNGELALINTYQSHGTWYRPDGKALPGLPTDPYHTTLYMKKGWSQTPPAGVATWTKVAQSKAVVEPPAPIPVPQAVVEAPPRHIHVMLAAIGSPCLVQGCAAKRQKPPMSSKRTSSTRRK